MPTKKGSRGPPVPRVKAEILAMLQRQLIRSATKAKSIQDTARFADPHDVAELEYFSKEMLRLADHMIKLRMKINARSTYPLRRVK